MFTDSQLVVLTPENRDSLLSTAAAAILDRQDEAAQTLARLRKLNPALADQFHPKQHTLADLTLRVLCSPGTKPSRVPSYIIVSYCWHYREWPVSPNAFPIHPQWEISKPMVDAVMAQRTERDEGVWLDKLCIDQDNEQEKSVAIGAMDVIYRAARRLFILLEDVQLDEDEELAGLTYARLYAEMCTEINNLGLEGEARTAVVRRYFDRQAKLDDKTLARVLRAAKPFAVKMLGARWYSRAWCAHESRVVTHRGTNNPIFLCYGPDRKRSVQAFEFRFVHFLSLRLYEIEPEPEPEPAIGKTDHPWFMHPDPRTLRERLARIQHLMMAHDSEMSPMQHIVTVLGSGCLHSRDLVSIALNTAGIPLTFRDEAGMVRNHKDVVWIFSALAIASGNVVPLIMNGEKLRTLGKDGQEVISWVVDPVDASAEQSLQLRPTESITMVTPEFIELDLLLFTGRPLPPTAASMEKAASALDRHRQTTDDGERTAMQEISSRFTEVLATATRGVVGGDRRGGPLETALEKYLGVCIDCGIDWMRRFPSVLQQGMSGSWIHGLDAYPLGSVHDAPYTSAAIDLLSRLDITESNTTDFTSQYLEPTIRLFTSLTDTRMKLLAMSPHRLQAADGDFALTESHSNRSWFAVPVAIADQPFFQKRAWVVEPFDPAARPERVEDYLPTLSRAGPGQKAEFVYPVGSSDEEDRRAPRDDERAAWRLRATQALFGCGPIVADGKHVVLLRKQKVYGCEDYDWKAIADALAACASARRKMAEEDLALRGLQ